MTKYLIFGFLFVAFHAFGAEAVLNETLPKHLRGRGELQFVEKTNGLHIIEFGADRVLGKEWEWEEPKLSPNVFAGKAVFMPPIEGQSEADVTIVVKKRKKGIQCIEMEFRFGVGRLPRTLIHKRDPWCPDTIPVRGTIEYDGMLSSIVDTWFGGRVDRGRFFLKMDTSL